MLTLVTLPTSRSAWYTTCSLFLSFLVYSHLRWWKVRAARSEVWAIWIQLYEIRLLWEPLMWSGMVPMKPFKSSPFGTVLDEAVSVFRSNNRGERVPRALLKLQCLRGKGSEE